MGPDRGERAKSFGSVAAEYERSRPMYPDEAVDWLVPEGAQKALDLGAGTGKLTRSLVVRGLETVAVEPLEEMRETLRAALPGVRALDGTAEAIPMEDASVDLVTVAQAWHWIDAERALPEIARVLRPNGALVLVWNRRDERVPWVAELSRVMESGENEMIRMEDVRIGPPFGAMETFVHVWSREMDLELLQELVSSRSYVITASEEKREAIRERVRHLVETDPALTRRKKFDLPYRTFCFRAVVG
jgi:ubiquinone/menaquinone biosynthesis C-methylase UbiE